MSSISKTSCLTFENIHSPHFLTTTIVPTCDLALTNWLRSGEKMFHFLMTSQSRAMIRKQHLVVSFQRWALGSSVKRFSDAPSGTRSLRWNVYVNVLFGS